ncbi:hypothetical protein GCM10010254_35710 [Streptomyces chromofuscus]|nr:hypothetical protein GCM10010254_35710 [Streptomyces chromofuscus]
MYVRSVKLGSWRPRYSLRALMLSPASRSTAARPSSADVNRQRQKPTVSELVRAVGFVGLAGQREPWSIDRLLPAVAEAFQKPDRRSTMTNATPADSSKQQVRALIETAAAGHRRR